MVLEHQECEQSRTDLPPLCLKSMTQVQLEKLVPKLVTKVTGRKSPLFGTVGEKPAWWPKSIDWIDPDQLGLKYEDPCERLREIVRCCYEHSEKENLLYIDETFMRSMPSSPSPADTEMCVADQATSPPTSSTSEHPETVNRQQTCFSKTATVTDTTDTQTTTQTDEGKPAASKTAAKNNTVEAKVADPSTQPIEILSDEEMTGDSKKKAQEPSQTGSMAISSISPSIISEIDKHIMESISSKFVNLGKLGPRKPRIGPKSFKRGLSVGLKSGAMLDVQSKNLGGGRVKKPGLKVNGAVSQNPGQSAPKSISKPVPPTGSKIVTKTEKNSGIAEGRSQPKLQTDDTGQGGKIKTELSLNTQDDDEVVWICFICAKGFNNQSDLMAHQDLCEDSNEEGDNVNSTPAMPSDPQPFSDQVQKAFPEPVKVKGHSSDESSKGTAPVPALLRKVGSDIKTLPLGLPTKPRTFPSRKRKRYKDIYIPPPRDTYFESLGLVPTPKMEQIKTPLKNENTSCQIIDLTLDEDKSPQSQPMTPRTHLIMSQVSRDDHASGRRRQLSFSQMTPPKAAKKEESDSESSESSVEEVLPRRNVPCKSVILAIPLTSLLGQRLKKHWQSDNKIPIISDSEVFCQTSNMLYYGSMMEQEPKNKFTEKLRNRPPPQLTFRFTKKYINKWFHKYKFNRADKLEFERNIATGLEIESRRRLKKMKKCKVTLARLSKRDIKQWTERKPRFHRSISNLQLMRQNYNNQIRRSLQHSLPRNLKPTVQLCRSPFMLFPNRPRFTAPVPAFAQGHRNRAGPIPQFLVRNDPNGASRFRMELLKVGQKTPFVPTERRKQTFQKLKIDEGTVICLSSDEEDSDTSLSCNQCQRSKSACCCKQLKKPKIGPASFMKHQQVLQQKAQVLRKPSYLNQTASPVSMIVNTGKADSVSSRMFGKSVVKEQNVMPTSSSQGAINVSGVGAKTFSTTQSSPVVNGGDFTHIQMVNGKIVKQETGSASTSGSHLDQQVPRPGSPMIQDNNQSDSEYMDFEVICIDSDDDS